MPAAGGPDGCLISVGGRPAGGGPAGGVASTLGRPAAGSGRFDDVGVVIVSSSPVGGAEPAEIEAFRYRGSPDVSDGGLAYVEPTLDG